jgi:hypothetical protein
MLDVFSVCVAAELSVSPANGSLLFSFIFETCPHCARHAQPPTKKLSPLADIDSLGYFLLDLVKKFLFGIISSRVTSIVNLIFVDLIALVCIK